MAAACLQGKINATLPPCQQEAWSEAEQKWLQPYLATPLWVDVAGIRQLAEAGLINPAEAEIMQAHITRYGALRSLHELRAMAGCRRERLGRLIPYLCIPPATMDGWWRASRQRHGSARATLDIGYKPPPPRASTLGSAVKQQVQYCFSKPACYALNFYLEKGEGEPLWLAGSRSGPFLYRGGYAACWQAGAFPRVVAGDYEVGLGQGLVTGNNFALDKSDEVITAPVKAAYQGVKPYTATTRKGGMRGLGLHYSLAPAWTLLGYLSQCRLDIKAWRGQVRTLAERATVYATAAALRKRGQLRERTAGGALLYQPTSTRSGGLQVVCTDYDQPVNLSAQQPHSLFFQGRKNMVASLFAEESCQPGYFFGEVALSGGRHIAALLGCLKSFGYAFDIAGMGYYYSPGFHACHGHAWHRNGQYGRNLRGVYIALAHQQGRWLAIRGATDFFQYIAAQKKVSAGAMGMETRLFVSYRPSRSYHLEGKWSYVYAPDTRGRKGELDAYRQPHLVKLKCSYPLHGSWQAGSAIHIAPALHKDGWGVGMRQQWQGKHGPWKMKGWGTLYKAGSYREAIHFPQPHYRPGMYQLSCYGNGVEAGLLLSYTWSRHWKLTGRLILQEAIRPGADSWQQQWKLQVQLAWRS